MRLVNGIGASMGTNRDGKVCRPIDDLEVEPIRTVAAHGLGVMTPGQYGLAIERDGRGLVTGFGEQDRIADPRGDRGRLIDLDAEPIPAVKTRGVGIHSESEYGLAAEPTVEAKLLMGVDASIGVKRDALASIDLAKQPVPTLTTIALGMEHVNGYGLAGPKLVYGLHSHGGSQRLRQFVDGHDLARQPCPTVTALGMSIYPPRDYGIAGAGLDGASEASDDGRCQTVAPSGLVVAGTFSGAGGSSTGWRAAGAKVAVAVEFIAAAAAAYRRNHPTTAMIERDIRTVSGDEILEAAGGPIDVLEGSPPCTSFSPAGKRHRGWGEEHDVQGRKDRSDDLLLDWVRLIRQTRPRAFAAENVPGLARGAALMYFDRFRTAIEQAGYSFAAAVLRATDYGVPQDRRRLFMVGFLDPADAARFTWPQPTQRVRSAAPTLRAVVELDSDPVYRRSEVYRRNARARVAHLAKRDAWLRADLEHYAETLRPLTIAEGRAVCGFPPGYWLGDVYREAWARLGNAVPPPLAHAVARAVSSALGCQVA